MSEHIKAWQCIGCGRIEAAQTCIGVCQDRRVEFVYADEHEEVVAELDRTRRHLAELSDFVRRLARTTPRGQEWERSYRAFQAQARELVAALG